MFACGGFKGKAMMGKGKGKGKGKISPEGGKGHTLPRTRLSAEKFAGTVVAWKGKYGWIQPGEEIEHEKAKLHNGSLFVGMNDIEGGEGLEVGAPVDFHICEDDSGLGAEEVVQTGGAPPGAAAAIAAKGKGKTFVPAASKGAAVKGIIAPKGGKDFGKAAPKGAAWGGKDQQWGAVGKGCFGGKGFAAGPPAMVKTMDSGKWGGGKPVFGFGGKPDGGKFGKGKGKGKDSNKGKGHLLPRTRISEEKFSGTITDWKGKYGWIQPAEEIQHEKAGKHQGKLFVSKDDLEGTEELTPGTVVDFHIWEDATGLGAEEVSLA